MEVKVKLYHFRHPNSPRRIILLVCTRQLSDYLLKYPSQIFTMFMRRVG